jgi:hypothetical protein
MMLFLVSISFFKMPKLYVFESSGNFKECAGIVAKPQFDRNSQLKNLKHKPSV